MKSAVYSIIEDYEIKINLKKLLDEKNINRFTFSKLTDTKIDTINRFYYNNITKIDLDVIKRFCIVLDCNINDLLVLVKK